MSIIRNPHKVMDGLIEELVREYKTCKIEGRFGRTRTSMRKSSILRQITQLRASMSPQCDCKKIETNRSP
jgi:hypothetical protein